MQNPITPVLPVQSTRAASNSQAESIASNAGPDPACSWRKTPRTHRTQDSPGVQVGRQSEIALGRQPVRLAPDVGVQPERLVDDHDAGQGPAPAGSAR